MTSGAGTLAYGITAGAAGATAVVFLFIAFQRRGSERLFFGFGVFALTMAFLALVTVWMQKSGTVDEYTVRLKLFGVANLAALLATVWLVQTWTAAIRREVMIAFVGASAGIAVLLISLPAGLLAGEVTSLRAVHLFGETFVVHEASNSPWRPVLEVYLLVFLGIVAVALWRGLRRGPHAESAVLATGIAGVVAVGLYDSLVDEAEVNTPYLAPFGSLFLVVVTSLHLARRMAATERRLAAQTTDLEVTVIDRTAALMDANRRLQHQLAQQRVSARRLAALAEQFESVNELALRHDDAEELERTLLSVLANLGDLLGARTVGLRVSDPSLPFHGDIRWGVDDPSDPDDGTAELEPIVIGPRRLGELSVVPSARWPLDAEEQRYIQLTCDHLAGFLDRLDLSDKIAASAVDAERHRIARELHDSVTQKLYSVSFLADAVPVLLDDDPRRATETVGRMRQLLLSSLAELRTLLFELQPEALDATSLPRLIAQLTEMFATVDALTVETDLDPVPTLPLATKVGFYRIAQEALSNAARHSGSDVVSVELHEVDSTVELTVRDRGVGFDPNEAGGGHGLGNMRQRATSLGAQLIIDATPGVGTDVSLRWTSPRGSATVEDSELRSVPEPR
jgi:signal transduction histidine kinase